MKSYAKLVMTAALIILPQALFAASFSCTLGNLSFGSEQDNLGYAMSYVSHVKSSYEKTDLTIRYIEEGRVLQVLGSSQGVSISAPISMEIEYPQENIIQGLFSINDKEIRCSYSK